MAIETARTVGKKAVILPGGNSTTRVWVPVIRTISFLDPNDRGQETQFTIDNTATSTRRVHVIDLESSDGGDETLPVERIDMWPVFDANDRGQETQVGLDNVTGEDSEPPHFTAHLKTHVFRYTQGDSWIDSEIIDQLAFIDPNERYQETVLTLTNPDIQASDNDPDITDSGNGVDPPYRIDPFQNLIDFSSGEPTSATGGPPEFIYGSAGNVSVVAIHGVGGTYSDPYKLNDPTAHIFFPNLEPGSNNGMVGYMLGTAQGQALPMVAHPTGDLSAVATGDTLAFTIPDNPGFTANYSGYELHVTPGPFHYHLYAVEAGTAHEGPGGGIGYNRQVGGTLIFQLTGPGPFP